MRRRSTRLLVVALAVALIAGAVAALTLLPSRGGGSGEARPSPSPVSKQSPAPVVETASGRVRGAVIAGVPSYLGIPYAAPPVGALRWRPPQPPAPWTGVRRCVSYGPSCPQMDSGYQTSEAVGSSSEDCLYLNVYTPAPGRKERLPVMVWIHGGGFTSGSGVLPNFQGQTLARGEHVVVVSMNYRLGVFGFFALEALSAESEHGVSGNYGIMDQTYALHWVRRNIAAFGGDPKRVTIFGQSAGAQSVFAHYVSPLSRGLFARAISESARYQDSGIGLWATLPLSVQEVEGQQISDRLHVPEGPDQLAALRSASVRQLLAVAAPQKSPYPLGFVTPAEPSFQPVVDGYVLPRRTWKLLQTGAFARVPLLVGSNAQECNMWVSSISKDQTATVMAAAQAEMEHYMGPMWPSYSALFPTDLYGGATEATSKKMTVAEFYTPARYAAHCVSWRGVPAYLYYFTQEPPGTDWGAVHCSEIPFVFGTAKVAYGRADPADIELSADMSGYWAGFAATGDPNGGGRPPWPAYHDRNAQLMRLGHPYTGATAAPFRKASDLAEIAAHVR